jgi:hypothetical protein
LKNTAVRDKRKDKSNLPIWFFFFDLVSPAAHGVDPTGYYANAQPVQMTLADKLSPLDQLKSQ